MGATVTPADLKIHWDNGIGEASHGSYEAVEVVRPENGAHVYDIYYTPHGQRFPSVIRRRLHSGSAAYNFCVEHNRAYHGLV